jgi:hypothetical protein
MNSASSVLNVNIHQQLTECYLLLLLGGITGGPPLISRLQQSSKVRQTSHVNHTIISKQQRIHKQIEGGFKIYHAHVYIERSYEMVWINIPVHLLYIYKIHRTSGNGWENICDLMSDNLESTSQYPFHWPLSFNFVAMIALLLYIICITLHVYQITSNHWINAVSLFIWY